MCYSFIIVKGLINNVLYQRCRTSIHLIPKAWSEHGVEALWTGQKNTPLICPVHNASTPCSLQAFGIRCIPFELAGAGKWPTNYFIGLDTANDLQTI